MGEMKATLLEQSTLLEVDLATPDEQAKANRLCEAALSWFRENARAFPWRSTRDPYHILVAEICLQKTNADKVAPVFERIIKKYPTIAALAKADPNDINDHFSRLGLFKRGGFLLEIAKEIVEQYDGVIPRDRETLLKVKGIGDYTTNSVLCLAHDDRLPLLDGSTQRVLARVFSRSADKPAWANRAMRAFMQSILPNNQAREFNLALIDIADRCCRPRKPKCAACPLEALCLTAETIGRLPNGS